MKLQKSTSSPKARVFFACMLVVILAGAFMRGHKTPQMERTLALAFCEHQRDEMAIRPLLTTELDALWTSATARNDAIARAHPDEKPPLGDGVPLQAAPDYAPVCKPGATKTAGGQRLVDIAHQFPDDTAANWTDQLVLRREGGKWRIDDILFAPDGTTSLRQVLRETLTVAP